MRGEPASGNAVPARVVLLNGSPRKGNTRRRLLEIADLLRTEGVDTTLIDLGGYRILDCTGCERCIRETSRCVLPDHAEQILSQLLQADGVVLGSPVYVGTVPGVLKSLLDKTASWLHRPPAVGLPVLPVVTTAGSGDGATVDYLREAVGYWGAHPLKGIRRSASRQSPIQRREIDAFLRHLRLPKSRGWDERIYYYDCRISPLKRLAGSALFAVPIRRIRPTEAF